MARFESCCLATKPSAGLSAMRSAKSTSRCVEMRITAGALAAVPSAILRATSKPALGTEVDVDEHDVGPQVSGELQPL
jgi:hypothetical protein